MKGICSGLSSVVLALGVMAATASVVLPIRSAHAANHIWSGASSPSMTSPLNWSSGGVPPVVPLAGSNETLIFPISGSYPQNDIASPLTVQSIQFTGVGNYNFTLYGNPIRMDNLGAAPTITALLNVQSQQIQTDLVLAANTTASGSIRFQGGITGPGMLTVDSPLSYTYFDGATPVTTDVTVSNGAQVYFNKGNNNQAVGANLTINNASVSDFYSNQFLLTTNVDISANGSLVLYANERANNINVNSGNIQLSGGTFLVAGSIISTGGAASFSNYGTIDLNGTQHIVSVANPGLANALAINVNIGNGTINKTGNGVLNLNSAGNTFTGQNIVSAGTLRGWSATIGNNILNNAKVEIYNGAYSGNISGPGTVNIAGYVQYLTPQSYGGGTFIDTLASLDGTTATLLGNITANGPQAAISLNQAANGTLTAALAGPLDIQKNGTAIITINTPNAHTGNTNINDGGIIVGASNALGTSTVSFGSYPNTVTLEATAPVNLPNPLNFSGSLTVQGGGNINITSVTNKNNNNNTLTHNSTGTTTIDGKFNVGTTGSVVVNNGTLVLGNPAAVGGFTSQGQVIVNGGTLTVRSFNFVTLPDVTLAGGTLNAPNGYAIPLGAALQGFGAVTGRVSSANGSTILAAGNLGIGDASHPAGVNLDGELYTNQYNVTLNDSNQAVLGSLTHLGNGPGIPGTLISPNGLVLNFGRNITGNGTINSINALAKAIISNGDVNGDSFVDPIVFNGYVKGVGTFNNTIFGGTFAPGFSPALLTVGTIGFTSTNVFEEEIGGLNRGSQYDAIDATGSIYLDGQLKVLLINGFNPVAGNSFDLFNGTEVGTFSSYNLAPLSPGLAWDTSQLYSQGMLNVVAVPEPSSVVLLLAGLTGLLAYGWRKRK